MTQESAVLTKTRELCETLVAQPDFLQIRRSIEAFMADEQAQDQLEKVETMGQSLQHKQRSGQVLAETEIAEFERQRQALMENRVARGFIDAQNEMQDVRKSIVMHVMKTFELGRAPEPDDFQSCGSGCSCH